MFGGSRKFALCTCLSPIVVTLLFNVIWIPRAIHAETSIIPSSTSTRTQASIIKFQKDIERVNNLAETELTAPSRPTCRDSSYTKEWDFEDWESHQVCSLNRYARHIRTWVFSTTARKSVPAILAIAIWTSIVSKMSNSFPKFQMGTTKMTVTLTFAQAPILLMLTLRTNRALDRMLDARRAWGAFTKSARSLMGLVCAYIIPNQPEAGMLIARYLAFSGWSLKGMLRKRDDDSEMIAAMFGSNPEETEWLLNCKARRPIIVISRLRHLLSILEKDRRHGGIPIPPMALLRMEETLFDLESAIGTCNRNFVSPIPPTYTRHTSRVLVLYMCLLPIALAGMDIPFLPAVVTATFASYIMVGIDEIGTQVENPFKLLPMQSLSKGLQNDVEMQVNMMSTMPPMP